ncbi:MAG TPA: MFS transporter [Anaerolineae bacterium]
MNRFARLLLASLPVAFAGTATWFGLYTFVKGYLIKGLGYSNEQWTEVTLWFTGSMIVWQLLCTDIAARLGRRNTVTLSLAAGAVFYIAIALTNNGPLIRGLMALAGFTQAVGIVTWQPLVANYGGEKPGRALAVSQWVAAGVGVLTLVIGGQAIASFSYREAFIGLGAVCVVCAVFFHFVSRGFEEGQIEVVGLMRAFRADWRKLATGTFLILTFVAICLEPFNYLTVNQLFPNLARDVHGLLDRDISMLVAVARLPALVTLFVMAAVIDRLDALRTYGIGIAVVGVSVVALGLANGLNSFIALYFVYFLFQGFVWGSNAAAVNASVAPELRDSAFAITSIVMSVALFGAGFVHNRLLGAGFNIQQVFSTVGFAPVVAGAILVAWTFVNAHRPAEQLTTESRGTQRDIGIEVAE